MPPSMSTQRNIGAELAFCVSRSNAVSLLRILDVALEENDPAGLKLGKHEAQALRHGSAVEAHDEQLANLPAKFEAAF